MTLSDDAYRAHYGYLRRAALAHPRPRIAEAWTHASIDAAAAALAGSREPRARWLAMEAIAGLVAGRWDRVVAAAVRVPCRDPEGWRRWSEIAASEAGR